MSDDLSIRGSVDIQTSAARRAMNALAREIESYNKLTDKSSASARAQRTGIKQLSDTVNMLTQNLAKAEAAEKAFAKAQARAANATTGSATTSRVQSVTPVDDSALTVSDRAMSQSAKYRTDEQTKLNAAKNEEVAANNKILTLAKAKTEEEKQSSLATRAAASANEADSRVALNNARAQTEEIKQRVALERAAAAAVRDTAVANQAQIGALNGMRYALYDVSRVAAVAAVGLGAAFVAPIATAISWEREFANVQRTVFAGTDATQKQIGRLRDDFVDLVRTIPTNWEELTEVGALAGQLGIASNMVTGFTKTVVQFSATTDVSADQAATAFGRLDNILLNNSGNFDGLASSVLRVGVNSVATESQILKITTQIASVAKQANFSADEVIGLSGALASLGVPPELSRGVITRVFGEIGRAVSEGGPKLEKFGNVAQTSGKQFAEGWKTDAAGEFQDFLNGINAAGPEAESAIRSLGITSVRDVPILLRLANSGTVVADAFRDAAIGFKDATELGSQYGVIATTVDSKLKVLGNTIASLFDEIGSSTLGPLGDILDYLVQKVTDFAEFAETGFGQWVVGIGLAVTAITAVLALLVAIGTRGLASISALTVSMVELSTVSGGATLSLAGMIGVLEAAGPAGAKAATALRLVSTAVKGLVAAAAITAAIVFLPDIMEQGLQYADAARGIDRSLLPTLKRLGTYAKDATPYMDDLADGFKNISQFSPSDAGRDLNTIQEALRETAKNGSAEELASQLRQVSAALDMPIPELIEKFPDLKKQLDESGDSFIVAGDGSIQFSNSVTGAKTAISDFTEEEQAAQQATKDWISAFAETDAAFLNIGEVYDSMIEANKKLAQDKADETIDNISDSWHDYFDGFSVNVDEYLDNLQKIVDAQSNWELNLLKLAARGAGTAVIDELRKLGPEGAPLVQQFVDGTDEQLQRFASVLENGASDATTGFATTLKAAVDTPGFLDAVNALGPETANKILSGLQQGLTTVPQVIADYDLDVEIPVSLQTEVDPVPAESSIAKLDQIANPRQADYSASVDEQARLQAQFKLDNVRNPRQADYYAQTDEQARQDAINKLNEARNPRVADFYAQTHDVDEARRQLDEAARDRTANIFASLRVDQTSVPASLRIPGPYTGGLIGELAGIPGYARGGFVGGARAPQKYQDTLLTRLRPAEFVVNEDSVDYYGKGFFNALNNRSLDTSDFMRPVPVAQRARNNGSSIQLTELVAGDKALLGAIVQAVASLNLTLPPSDAAAAANKGNTSSFKKGAN